MKIPAYLIIKLLAATALACLFGCASQAPVAKNASAAAGIAVPPAPRVDFHRHMEPAAVVLTGAGQTYAQKMNSFADHAAALGPGRQPVIYMSYISLKRCTSPEELDKRFQHLKTLPGFPIPQIGLSFTSDGKPEEVYDDKVAAGEYDSHIIEFCKGLHRLGRPAYVRVGYEFNGAWNGYRPQHFKPAFQRIATLIRKHAPVETAVVWTFAVDGDEDDFMKFYPGDEYTDWWGIDLFGEHHFNSPECKAFMDSSMAHRFPVMIGECTPRRVNVQLAEESWRRWYVKYFELIHFWPNIKALSYINWNWQDTAWPDWGDGRIEANEFVRSNYIKEISLPLYAHDQSPAQLRKLLRLPAKKGSEAKR